MTCTKLRCGPEFISSVTDAVISEVTTWQNRPLETMYPVVFFDALRVKIRADGVVRNKAVYLALGVLADGTRDILGLWIENTEGAKFWTKVFNDMKTRGCNDVLIAVTDGLKGMSEALEVVYPVGADSNFEPPRRLNFEPGVEADACIGRLWISLCVFVLCCPPRC